jgi:hypothetical protein
MMNGDSPDKEVLKELTHYMRKSSDSVDKELVVEKVKLGSFSYDFIQRMDELRRNRECVIAIDMRGKVPYECKSYTFRNQVFWMDDITYSLFSQGLKESGGVYTVGLFESLMNASHTNRALEAAGRNETSAGQSSRMDEKEKQAARPDDGFNKYLDGGERPDLIPLGFFRKRRDERLQYTTDVQILADGMVLPLKTFDISKKGIQLYSKHPPDLAPDMTVLVNFTGLNDSMDAGLVNIQYQILNVEKCNKDYRIRMLCSDPDSSRVEEFLGRIIENELKLSRGRRRLDHEDEIETCESLLAELYYGSSTKVIPFIVYGDNCQEPDCVEIAVNTNNQSMLSVFSGEQGFGARHIFSADILNTLLDRKELEGRANPLMMVYEDNGQAAVVYDCDFETEVEWLESVRKYIKRDKTRVFRLMARTATHPDSMKLDFKTSRLKKKSKDVAFELIKRLDAVLAVGSMADITDIVRDYDFDQEQTAEGGLIREGNDSDARKKKKDEIVTSTVNMDHVESRIEDRYIVRVRADIDFNGQSLHAETIDLSTRGLCLDINSFDRFPETLRAGEKLLISFPSLQKKVQSRIKLKNMKYEVKSIKSGHDGKVGLSRIGATASDDYSQFFRMLINQNKEKIRLEMSDTIDAATARVYQTYIADNTSTIPFYIYKSPDSNDRQLLVALPSRRNSLASFFELEPGSHDFGAISLQSRLLGLMGSLRKKDAAELLVYMYRKQRAGEARFDIYSATDYDFEIPAVKKTFMDEALKNEYCVVKLLAGKAVTPESVEVNAALERLHNRSPHHASRVRQRFELVTAVGDIIDVTRQAIEAYT